MKKILILLITGYTSFSSFFPFGEPFNKEDFYHTEAQNFFDKQPDELKKEEWKKRLLNFIQERDSKIKDVFANNKAYLSIDDELICYSQMSELQEDFIQLLLPAYKKWIMETIESIMLRAGDSIKSFSDWEVLDQKLVEEHMCHKAMIYVLENIDSSSVLS